MLDGFAVLVALGTKSFAPTVSRPQLDEAYRVMVRHRCVGDDAIATKIFCDIMETLLFLYQKSTQGHSIKVKQHKRVKEKNESRIQRYPQWCLLLSQIPNAIPSPLLIQCHVPFP